jgi:hypothetical protein
LVQIVIGIMESTTQNLLPYRKRTIIHKCVISGFRRGVEEVFALVGLSRSADGYRQSRLRETPEQPRPHTSRKQN